MVKQPVKKILTFSFFNRAFVAPADIQAFTIEVKNKLSARCRGKTIKHFAQAVKEICAEFEQLQEKSSVGPRDDDNDLDLGTASLSADGLVDDAVKANLMIPIGNDGASQSSEFKSSALERCSLRQGVIECQDTKPCVSSGVNSDMSPIISSKKGSRFPDNGNNTVKEEIVSTSSPNQSSRKVSGSRYGGLNSKKNVDLHAGEEGCSPLLKSEHSEDPDDVQKDVTNGYRRRLASGSKRRVDGSCEMHNSSGSSDPASISSDGLGSNRDLSASSQPSGADARRKVSSSAKESSQNVLRSGLDSESGKKRPKLLKDKKNVLVAEKTRVATKERHEDKGELSSKKQGDVKQTSQTNEHSHPAKRSKHVNVADDAPKALLQAGRKITAQSCDDKLENVEVKRNVLRGKAENRSGSRPLSTTRDSTLGGDEDVLPPTKRRRRALEAMSGSSTLMSENRFGRSSGLKNDMSRRRAVRLCDDDEEEEPKTPIHGGSAKKVLVPLHGQSSSKRADNDPLGKRDSVTFDDSSLKKAFPSDDCSIESCLPVPQQAEEKQHGKTEASHASLSPGKVDSEKLPSNDTKPFPPSPQRSPIVATKSVADTQKVNKHVGKVPGNNTQRKAVSGSKIAGGTSDNLSLPATQTPSGRGKPEFSGERNKEHSLPAGNVMDIHFLPVER